MFLILYFTLETKKAFITYDELGVHRYLQIHTKETTKSILY